MEHERKTGEKHCPLHNEEVQFQCTERNCDQILICQICITDEHRGHRVDRIKDDTIVAEKRSILYNFVETLNGKKSKLVTHHDALQKKLEENENNFSHTKNQIQEHFEQMEIEMLSMKSKLLKQCQLCYTQNKENIETCSNRFAGAIVECTRKEQDLNTTRMGDEYVMIFDTARKVTSQNIPQQTETPKVSITTMMLDEITSAQRKEILKTAFTVHTVSEEWHPTATSAQVVNANYQGHQHEETRTLSDIDIVTSETSVYQFNVEEDVWVSSIRPRRLLSSSLSFRNQTPQEVVPSTPGGTSNRTAHSVQDSEQFSVLRENSDDIICVCPTVLKQYEYHGDIKSIALSDNKIWVSSKYRNKILLMKENEGVTHPVREEQMIFDISVSPSTKNLWYCDSLAVKEVNFEQYGYTTFIKSWPSDFTPSHLCITSKDKKDRVILADDERIVVYSVDGTRLYPERHQSQQIVANPLHIAVCPITRNIAVANSDMTFYGGKGKPHVIIANEKLEVKHKFYGPGIRPNRASADIFCPTDIVYNSFGQLIIADSANGHVILSVDRDDYTLITILCKAPNYQFPAIGLSQNGHLYVCASPDDRRQLRELSTPRLRMSNEKNYIIKLQL